MCGILASSLLRDEYSRRRGDDCLSPFANGNRALPFQRSFTCCPEQLRYLGLPLAAGSGGPVARGGTFL